MYTGEIMAIHGNLKTEIGVEESFDYEGDDSGGAVRLCYRMMSRTQSEEGPESPIKKSHSSGTSSGKFFSRTETIPEELEQEQEKEPVSRTNTGTSFENENVFNSSSNPDFLKDIQPVTFETNSSCYGSTYTLDDCSNTNVLLNGDLEKSEDFQILQNSEQDHCDVKPIIRETDMTLRSTTFENEHRDSIHSLRMQTNFYHTHRHSDTSLLKRPEKVHRASDAVLNRPFLKITHKSSKSFETLFNIVNLKHRRRATDCPEDDYWIKAYKCSDLFLALFGIGFFLADVISDWRLALLYYFDNQLPLFILTVIFIVLPSLISAVITIIWSVMDHQVYKAHVEAKKSRHMRRNNTVGDHILLVLKVIFSVFQLGRCFRSFVFIIYVIRSWCTPAENKVKLHLLKKKALEQKHDAAILGLVDGFLEASSQFMLQMYLSVSYKLEMDFARIATICLSFLSTALLHTSYYKNNRKVQKFKPNVGYLGGAVYFLWRLCELGPRFLMLVLFTYCFRFWAIVPTVLQLILVFALFMYQKPKLKGICCTPTFDYLFCLLISYIGIFCFVNLKSSRTRYGSLIYYILFYAENVTMAVLVFLVCPALENDIGQWKYCVFLLIPGFVLHMFFMLLYYKSCHPRKCKKKHHAKTLCKDIRLCGIPIV